MAFKIENIVPWGRSLNEYRKFFSLSDNEFDIVLSSHFLFLYTEHFSLENHIKSIFEMLRVGKELRIFPLLDMNTNESAHLKPVLQNLENKNISYSVDEVDYEFQSGGNKMLKIWK